MNDLVSLFANKQDKISMGSTLWCKKLQVFLEKHTESFDVSATEDANMLHQFLHIIADQIVAHAAEQHGLLLTRHVELGLRALRIISRDSEFLRRISLKRETLFQVCICLFTHKI